MREGIDGHTCSGTNGFPIWTILFAQGDIMASLWLTANTNNTPKPKRISPVGDTALRGLPSAAPYIKS